MHRMYDTKAATPSTRSIPRGRPTRRVQRHVKPRSLDTYSNELHGRPEDDEEGDRSPASNRTSTPNAPQDRFAKLVAEINENYLGCLRVAKASVEFGRTAGRKLHQIQESIGDDAFDSWVDRRLPLSRDEAAALIRFSREPEVSRVDVSPATAMSLTKASKLAGLLYAHGSPAS